MIDIASPKPIELEDAVHDYVLPRKTPFTTDDALPDIVSRMTAPPSDPWTAVDEELMDSEWLFYDEKNDIYVPRCSFFQGAQFIITPRPEEIEANILIPGHRFMPFIERDVFPASCQLRIDDEAPIQTQVIKKPIQELLIYLSFYGPRGAIEYLTADQESNLDVMERHASSNNPEFAVTVFDMTDIYARHAFKAGDAFLCAVKDWVHGIYSIEHIPNDPHTLHFRISAFSFPNFSFTPPP